jgi:calcineurin-like phosphoesterase family protein
MSTTWFTSDLHLGHKNVIGFSDRPFKTVEEHDKALAHNWAARVRPEDIVWVLGDISIEGTYKHALGILASLPGRKRLVSGNHDQVWVGKSDWFRYWDDYAAVFEVITPFARAKIGQQPVMLSHFPYNGDHTREDRFDVFRLRHEHSGSSALIHGHTHHRLRWSQSRFGVSQVHVGVDAWDYRPVAAHELPDLAAGRDLDARREWVGHLAALSQQAGDRDGS